MLHTVLYVEPEKGLQSKLDVYLSEYFPLIKVPNSEKCLEVIEQQGSPLVLAEGHHSISQLIQLFHNIHKKHPKIVKILVQHYSKTDSCSGLIYYAYGIREFTNNGSRILKSYFDQMAIQELSAKDNGNSKNFDFPVLIGNNRFLMEALKQAKKFANLNESILITGKSGTGKDLFARYLHESGNRHKKPFHVVNCAAVHPGLFESEFFGHRKGSFTGAIDNLEGHFQKANGGILVLDEVSEIDISFQAKLLRAIENQEIMPVGRQAAIKIDTRIVAITNRDLEELIRSGKFREDLYYRLNVYCLKLPSLEERLDDLEILIKYFVQRYLSMYHSGHKTTINPAVYPFLKLSKFRGNIRELENLIAKVMSGKAGHEHQLEVEDFKPYVRQTNCGSQKKNNLKAFLQRMESERIQEVMIMSGFNITHAARMLGISRQNLQYRLKRLRGHDEPII